MLKVGITGGIGSGKSTVGKTIERMGFPVFYADDEGRNISNSDADVVCKVKRLFGEDIYIDGKLDRGKVASLVFSDGELLEKLNQIIHPAVALHFNVWVEKMTSFPFVFQESAIIVESQAYKNLDKVIVVTAPINVKIDRVVKRDNVLPEQVISRINNQLPEQDLLKHADFVVNNDGNQLILPQIIEIIDKLKSLL